MNNYKLFIALRYLKGQRKTPFSLLVTLFSIGGVLVGVAALIIVLSVMNGFEREVRTRIIGMTAHITIYSANNTIDGWEDLAKKLEKEKELVSYSPFVITRVAVLAKKSVDAMLLKGVIPEFQERVSNLSPYMKFGSFSFEDSTTNELIVGEFLAERLGIIPGDTVELVFPNLNQKSILGIPKISPKKFVVTGIFGIGLYEYDSELAYTSLKTLQNLMNLGNSVTSIELKIKDFYKANKVAKRIAALVGLPFYAVSWAEINKNLFSWIIIEKWTMFLLLSLIIGVAAFNIVSTLIMVVIEKTKEIGILKAIGASSKDIMLIFIYQAIIVGGVGILLGTILGGGICLIQEHFKIISLPPEIYSINALPVDTRAIDVILIITFTLVVILLSSLYPSKKASKLMPINAIRYG